MKTCSYFRLYIISMMPQAVTGLMGGFFTLVLVLDWIPAAAGLGTMLLILGINYTIGSYMGSVEKRNLELADRRISTLNEIVISIKARPCPL